MHDLPPSIAGVKQKSLFRCQEEATEWLSASSSSFPAIKHSGQELAPVILPAFAEPVATASSGLIPRPF